MVFTIKHNMEMTKSEKLLKKNIIKIQSFSKTYFQKDGFYQQTQHGNDKKKKFIEKNRKKILGDFFRYDVIQERMWFRGLLTPIFKKDGFYYQTQHGNGKK